MGKQGYGRGLLRIFIGLVCFCLLLAGVYWVSREGVGYRIPIREQATIAAPETAGTSPAEAAIPYARYALWLGGAAFALGAGAIALSIISVSRGKQIRRLAADRKRQTEEYGRMVYSLCGILENWETEPGKREHVMRVARYTRILAKLWGFPDLKAQMLGIYSMLHDIGMYYVPRSILQKSGSLTVDEYARVKRHVEHGYRYAERYGLPDEVRQIIRYHHEQWDGGGYHRDMAGPHIPLAARIVGLADTYDTLRMERVYRPSYTHAEAVEVIRQERGRMLDPDLVDLFTAHHTLFEDVYSQEILVGDASI